jgi:hypothetical protein
LWQIASVIGFAGTATLGILYGLAARKAGAMLSQVVLAEAAAARLKDEAARLRGLYVARERYIAEIEKKLFDSMPADRLADIFNGLLSDGEDRHDSQAVPDKQATKETKPG